jgi:colicin import membrane protein
VLLALLQDSEEAVAARLEANVATYVAEEKLPEEVARLKGQLTERGLKSKATRAAHNQKRTIVRLMQEAHLKKDSAALEARMQLLEMKQKQSQAEMESAAKELAEQKADQQREREERDAANEAARKEVEARQAMMKKLREDEMAKILAENELRRSSPPPCLS